MGDVVSLSKFRKQRQREALRQKSAANRQKSGRTRAELECDRAESEALEKHLDAHKRDAAVSDETPPREG